MKAAILRECLEIARDQLEATQHYFKHWTFVISNNKIISASRNSPDISPNFKLHSESKATKRAPKPLVDIEIVNIRLNRFGEFRRSRPCEGCMKLLELLDVRSVYYTTNEGFRKL